MFVARETFSFNLTFNLHFQSSWISSISSIKDGAALWLFYPAFPTPQKSIDKTGTAGKVGAENEKNLSGSFNITTASIACRNFIFHESKRRYFWRGKEGQSRFHLWALLSSFFQLFFGFADRRCKVNPKYLHQRERFTLGKSRMVVGAEGSALLAQEVSTNDRASE